jgi:hypothetical protein
MWKKDQSKSVNYHLVYRRLKKNDLAFQSFDYEGYSRNMLCAH